MTNVVRHRPVQSILCPIDFSAPSRLALSLAGRLSFRNRARLTVLFVNDPLLTTAAAVAYDENVIAERTGSELRRFAASALRKTGADAGFSSTIGFGVLARGRNSEQPAIAPHRTVATSPPPPTALG